MRLDRLIALKSCCASRTARLHLAKGEVCVGGEVCQDGRRDVDRFTEVRLVDQILQAGKQPLYLWLYKPAGILSATEDTQHRTVIDLIRDNHPELSEEQLGSLHLAGRLDRATTGLVLLTNDSRWSEGLTGPEKRIGKRYRVTTDKPVPQAIASVFERGVWLEREQVYTSPAQLEWITEHEVWLTIYEGRHHQVKRMFSLQGITVIGLHRESVGHWVLPNGTAAGASGYCCLTD